MSDELTRFANPRALTHLLTIMRRLLVVAQCVAIA